MRTISLLPALFLVTACGNPSPQIAAPKPSQTVKVAAVPPAVARVKVAPNVYFENPPEKLVRRVVFPAEVCMVEGPLELLVCKKFTKEHESILSADVDARDVHAALLAAGALPGEPVRFTPAYQAAHGSPISVTLEYEKDGQLVRIDGRQWIRDSKAGKPLASNWVFGGSRFFPDPEDAAKPKRYLANGGDLICVSNFDSAMLDLPINSSSAEADLQFEANHSIIPPVGTKVWVILETTPN